jgi:large subunit ribosomal protein L21e
VPPPFNTHTHTATEAPPVTKRLPKGPCDGFTLENVKMETITAIPYDIVKEGLQ